MVLNMYKNKIYDNIAKCERGVNIMLELSNKYCLESQKILNYSWLQSATKK